MREQKGFSLVVVLLFIGVFILTAGGVVVWEKKVKPITPAVPDDAVSNPILPVAQSLTGTWKLVAYKNLITGETETEPEDIWRSIIIKFVDDGKRGKLEGHTINNSVSGDYEMSNGNKIKVLRFGGSKAGEGWAWGYKFWDAIRQSSSYQIKGGSLLLYFNNDKELMEFVKK